MNSTTIRAICHGEIRERVQSTLVR